MEIKNKIENWIKETLKTDKVNLAHPKEMKNGDFAFFAGERANDFGRALTENNMSAGEAGIPEILEIKVAGPFVNFFLSKKFFADEVGVIIKEKESFGKTDLFKDQKIIIEHTQPNPFKEFHIGHLMNNAIGESVARILKSNGAETVAVSYHGDVGLHVAKAIWGKMHMPDLSWGEAYAYGAQNFEDHKDEITELNKKISDKSDEKINKLYEEGRESSLKYFDSLYEKLGSHFDNRFFENISGEIGKQYVLDNVGKTFDKDNGAVIFRGENFEPKTHTRVFINSDGIPTYEAKEIGLAELKKDFYYPYNKSITVTANEQDSFFDVTEVAIGLVFPELKGKLLHLSHGMLKLPSGKMSSRTGDVITAESLINFVKEKVEEKLKDREYSEKEKNEIAEAVAIGAIKYSILRQAIGGDIIFDFDKSISFEGDSGPYLQYTAVRAKSVLEKAAETNSEAVFSEGKSAETHSRASAAEELVSVAPTTRPEGFEITDLERYLYRFPEVVERAGREYAPHYIVTYLTELSGLFNSFYAKERIVDEHDESSPYKIALTGATFQVLKKGLDLLGIKVPAKM